MGLDDNYGRHPERLDDLLRAVGHEDRQRVAILSFQESRTLEAQSLGKLDHTSWGEVDWSSAQVVDQREVRNEAEAEDVIRGLIDRQISADSEAIVFWGNLVVPTIRISDGKVCGLVGEILATSHDTWIYFPREHLLIEHFHEGRVTAAMVGPEN